VTPKSTATGENDALVEFEGALAKGMRALGRRDPALRPLIKAHGMPTFRPHANYFDTLVNSIISQQISGSAAESIKRKLLAALGGAYDPRIIAEVPDELLRGAGISPQKLGYLRSLAEHFLDGRIRASELPGLSDEEVIAELTDIKGIGVWTAHMFLMFSLGRLDVLPVGDLGVQRGIQITYGLDVLPKPREVEAFAAEKGWAPYRSIASWYMWRVV
jgi:DNA-3-methyladenine glycosylase II